MCSHCTSLSANIWKATQEVGRGEETVFILQAQFWALEDSMSDRRMFLFLFPSSFFSKSDLEHNM